MRLLRWSLRRGAGSVPSGRAGRPLCIHRRSRGRRRAPSWQRSSSAPRSRTAAHCPSYPPFRHRSESCLPYSLPRPPGQSLPSPQDHTKRHRPTRHSGSPPLRPSLLLPASKRFPYCHCRRILPCLPSQLPASVQVLLFSSFFHFHF